MKNYFFLICFFLAITNCKALAQSNNSEINQYRFTGKVIEAEPDTSGSAISVKMKIEFEVKNVSEKNLIFWNRDSSDTEMERKIVRVVVSKSETFTEENIITTNFSEPSNFYGKSWEALRRSLDRTVPPSNKTFVVRTNQSWFFTSTVGLGIEKKKIVVDHLLLPDDADKIGNVWIKIYYKSWSPNIEPKSEYRATDLVYGKKLQKRWKPIGNLMLESLVSESITINLSSVLAQTPKK